MFPDGFKNPDVRCQHGCEEMEDEVFLCFEKRGGRKRKRNGFTLDFPFSFLQNNNNKNKTIKTKQ